ncbi:MAG: hypothetical protein AWM53_01208 [Candidatus Dichloromethanomonas elyunquensis]|nr:MAG: hypothetical protein AWM53_01208 [Candidatus Dichloromethanomonas elyunquensis]
MKEDKMTAIWEEDGDLMHLQKFFAYICQDQELKERIKVKTLQKILHSNDPQSCRIPAETDQNGEMNHGGLQKDGTPKNRFPLFKNVKNQLFHKKSVKWIAAAAVIICAVFGSSVFLMEGNSSLMTGSANPKAANKSGVSAVPPAPSSADKEETADRSSAVYSSEAAAGTESQSETIPRQKIIYVLDATLKAEDVAAAMKAIEDKVNAAGGYIAESNQSNNEKEMTGYLLLRVPVDQFQSFKEGLSQFGTVENEHLSSDDVSKQYYDVETRLKSWENQEKRYLEILQQARTVDDILKIENSLANMRREMESLKGQLKYWDNHVQYSEVRINISQTNNKLAVNDPWRPLSITGTLQAAKNAIIKTLSFLWNVVNYLIVFIGYVILPGILFVIAWLVYRKFKRKRK